MRVMLVGDLRSPHTVGWSIGLIELGIDLVLVSSRRLTAQQRAALPMTVGAHVAHEPRDVWSRARGITTDHPALLAATRLLARRNAGSSAGPRRPEGTGRGELPLELRIAARLGAEIGRLADRHRPDLVHALRIPFEGIAASYVAQRWPTAVSIWGQDLVRQAPASPVLAERTRAVLRGARGLHADCARDIALARQWGAPAEIPSLLAPGNMGFDESVFHPGAERGTRDVVICPRGPGSHVNYMTFLTAADQLTRRFPHITVVATGLAEVPDAEEARARAANPDRIVLTGRLSHAELADLYRRSLAVVSPTTGDGTPNSVLEAMASGAVPVVGDIEPLRDLLSEGLPDSLVHPGDAVALAARIGDVVSGGPDQWAAWSSRAIEIASHWSRRAAASSVKDWYDRMLSAGQTG